MEIRVGGWILDLPPTNHITEISRRIAFRKFPLLFTVIKVVISP